MVPLAMGLNPLARAAEPADASPYDANPACMDRTTDASSGACVPQAEGTPRHTYPARAPAARTSNTAAAAVATPAGATAATPATPASGPRDGGKQRNTK
jgi:hypothetical protein